MTAQGLHVAVLESNDALQPVGWYLTTGERTHKQESS